MTRLLVTTALVLAASAAPLKLATVPYLWIFLVVASASVVWIVIARAFAPRLIAVNLAAAFLALAGMEGYFAGTFSADTGEAVGPVEYDAPYFRPDEVLGYAPRPGVTVRARKASANQISFDATYSIDSLGLRASPPELPPDAPCVLFFGGSFTFGDGVENHETMPWIAGVLSGRRPYNFGFHGYGPHQMLAALEAGLVSAAVGDCDVESVVYQAMGGHPLRAAGRLGWDAHGPRYRVPPDGTVVLDGHFDDPERPPEPFLALLRWRVVNQLEKSHIAQRLVSDEARPEEDLDLFAAIVHASRGRVNEAWPTASFHMLLWDGTFAEGEISKIRESLRTGDVTVHLVSDILPPLPEGETYSLVDDGHPNARAHRLLAEYVAREILAAESR